MKKSSWKEKNDDTNPTIIEQRNRGRISGNRHDFLSLNFGLSDEETLYVAERIQHYRQFVYEVGSIPTEKRQSIKKTSVEKEGHQGLEITRSERFRLRIRFQGWRGVFH